ncbi:flagellar hook-length control protein FliK [Wenzhouxiangella limi]|uniref:Flagellar hook-length control protein-like C-terminal domain-containing protein n=1 Tax=Wenzhouxiangella limi TaxID=2707351 RepID=A0A845UZ84_9GAMM|nr:flagellar hook-length control protein FliK [Wenzhouxiangella limi]NDY97143.1 hypothetical protein [Wenzhouxiangella limi]
MMPQNLDALVSTLSGLSGTAGNRPGEFAGEAGVAAWAEALAMFEQLGQEATALGAEGGQASEWTAKLAELAELTELAADEEGGQASDWTARLAELAELTELVANEEGVVPEDLAAEFTALFDVLETGSGSTEAQPHYSDDFWPSAGEMMLLHQGISPWGESPSAEQQKWLDEVGPYLNIPELTSSYDGPVEVDRDFTLVNLAAAAGGDLQSAFRDGWLGRATPEVSRNIYEVRWNAWEQGALRIQSENGIKSARSTKTEDAVSITMLQVQEALKQLVEADALPDVEAMVREADAVDAQPKLHDIKPKELLSQLHQLLKWDLESGSGSIAEALTRATGAQSAAAAQESLDREQLLSQLRRVVSETLPGASGRQDSDALPENSPRQMVSTELSRREQIFGRIAEMQAMVRDGDGIQNRGMPEINRAVLLSQQLQNAGNAIQSAPTEQPTLSRGDASPGSLATASTTPARDPALPPTAQLLGQPGASAGEMRAAAEQAMQRVVWMAAREQGASQARLQLHPAHLGKVDVKLEVQGREASVVLNVQNGPIREAMEAMLPRLREQLEQQGINLGDASVFDSEPDDASPEEHRGAFAGVVDGGGEAEADELPVQAELNLRGRGLLDAYA